MVGPLEAACQEMMHGALDEHVIVDALQGGAGTSTNMNVNEVLANRAVQIAGFAPGDHDAAQSRAREPPSVDQRHVSHGSQGRRARGT